MDELLLLLLLDLVHQVVDQFHFASRDSLLFYLLREDYLPKCFFGLGLGLHLLIVRVQLINVVLNERMRFLQKLNVQSLNF